MYNQQTLGVTLTHAETFQYLFLFLGRDVEVFEHPFEHGVVHLPVHIEILLTAELAAREHRLLVGFEDRHPPFKVGDSVHQGLHVLLDLALVAEFVVPPPFNLPPANGDEDDNDYGYDAA